MAHSAITGWEEKDRKAEEKEKKRKKARGQPIQKPPRKKSKKSKKGKGVDVAAMLAAMEETGPEMGPAGPEMETAMAGPAQGNPMPSPKPPAWPTRPDGSRRLAKKGGVIRGMKGGGKVHRAGLARRRRSVK